MIQDCIEEKHLHLPVAELYSTKLQLKIIYIVIFNVCSGLNLKEIKSRNVDEPLIELRALELSPKPINRKASA